MLLGIEKPPARIGNRGLFGDISWLSNKFLFFGTHGNLGAVPAPFHRGVSRWSELLLDNLGLTKPRQPDLWKC